MQYQWDGGKATFRFWSRFHRNCGCHLPLTYNGKNHVSTLSPSLLIWSSSSLQVTRTDVKPQSSSNLGERGGSVVECRTPEREVGGSRPTATVLCPWARHFTPRKYWLITQETVAPSRYDWKIVDWDVKPQHKQTNKVRISAILEHWLWSYVTLSVKTNFHRLIVGK